MREVNSYASMASGEPLRPWSFERRDLRADDVALRILFCGVCASDVAAVRGASGPFPIVPGHEIVGEVTGVGADVSRFALGDRVVMGTIVDSCRVCSSCEVQEESYCLEGVTLTYASRDRHDGQVTRGGYSSEYVVAERFCYAFPEGLDPAGVAPLLCAGVTSFSPLRHWNVGSGKTVGIVGVGGLGHLAVKFARAMGAEVVAFTTSESKRQAALDLGAQEVVVSKNAGQMAAQASRFDLILDTASGRHDRSPYLKALKLDGTLCLLGFTGEPVSFEQVILTLGRRSVASSGVGGTRHTQEMLDFCQAHGITADVELIRMDQINEGFERIKRGDVHYRLVIDMATLSPEPRDAA